MRTTTTIKKEDRSFTRTMRETHKLLIDKYFPGSEENGQECEEESEEWRVNDKPFTEKEISEKIKELKNKKATTRDGISNEMIKGVREKLIGVLVKQFNGCLNNMNFPEV